MNQPPPVISLPVRIAAGFTGMLLVTLAIAAPFVQKGGAAPGLVIGFLGLLFLIPALKSSGIRTKDLGDIAVKYTRARVLQWLCLGAGAVGLFVLARRDRFGSPSDIRLVSLFMILWLAGFGFAGFALYYLEQARQLSKGREDDAA